MRPLDSRTSARRSPGVPKTPIRLISPRSMALVSVACRATEADEGIEGAAADEAVSPSSSSTASDEAAGAGPRAAARIWRARSATSSGRALGTGDCATASGVAPFIYTLF